MVYAEGSAHKGILPQRIISLNILFFKPKFVKINPMYAKYFFLCWVSILFGLVYNFFCCPTTLRKTEIFLSPGRNFPHPKLQFSAIFSSLSFVFQGAWTEGRGHHRRLYCAGNVQLVVHPSYHRRPLRRCLPHPGLRVCGVQVTGRDILILFPA
jgi:hypothetical protein